MYDITKTNNLAIQYIELTPLPKKPTKKYLINTNLPNIIKRDRTTKLIKHPNITKHSLQRTHTPGHTPNAHFNLYIRSNTLSKNKQTQIPTNTTYITKMQPILYPYITPYKIPTQHNTTFTLFYTHIYNNLPTHPLLNTKIPKLIQNQYTQPLTHKQIYPLYK
jgi:hypothetical protein